MIAVPGYYILRKDHSRRGGGVLFYIRENIKYKARQDIADISPGIESL